MKVKIVLVVLTALSLSALTTANVLDTFVIPHEQGMIDQSSGYDFDFDFDSASSSQNSKESSKSSQNSNESSENGQLEQSMDPSLSLQGDESYKSENMEESTSEESSSSSQEVTKTTVSFQTLTKKINNRDVEYYLADIHLSRLSNLRTHLAVNSSGAYGANIDQKFSDMVTYVENAYGKKVLAAISGDFPFWNGRKGYVVRNGVTYRDNIRTNLGEDLAIFKDGSVLAYNESERALSEIESQHGGIYQNWCFGPALIVDGEINVEQNEEIDGATMTTNQRTALGYAGNNHYYFLVTTVNGRRSSPWSAGFSLYHLATTLKELGCDYAYNLDGGDSASFYYGGETYLHKRDLGDMIYVVED